MQRDGGVTTEPVPPTPAESVGSDLLKQALTAIRDMEPEPVEEVPEHKNCAECDRLWNKPYSVSKMCDERYRQLGRRDRDREMNYNAQGGRMRRIATDALFLLDGGTIHGPTPEWLPEVAGESR